MKIVPRQAMDPLNLQHFVVFAAVCTAEPAVGLRVLQLVQSGTPEHVIEAVGLVAHYAPCNLPQAVGAVACMQGHNTHTG